MSKEHGWKNSQKKSQEGCMPFYNCSRSFVSKMVFSQRSRSIREKKTKKVAKGGKEKERYYDGEVHKK
jgi:hypothetical protein